METSEIKFVIPTRDDDLLEQTSDFYTVSLRPNVDDIVSKVFEFQGHMEANDWRQIMEHFDYFFFLVRHTFDGEPWRLRSQVLPLLNHGLELTINQVESFLPVVMGDPEIAVREENVQHRELLERCFQMYVYLVCRMGIIFEGEVVERQRSAIQANTKKGSRKAIYEKDDENFINHWINERERTVSLLGKVLGLSIADGEGIQRSASIRFLWKPPIVCPNFLRLVKEFGYKFLENPELGKVSGRQWLQAIFQYLRVICVTFEEFSRVGAKIVSLMKRLDYLSSASQTHFPYIDAIEAVSQHGDMDQLYLSILTAMDYLSASEFARSDTSARPFALFITTLAEKKPRLLSKNVVCLMPFLCDDPPILRCAVMSAFVEIVSALFKGNLPEGSRRTERDKLLLQVQDHIVDVSAVVRSRALQLFTKLARASQVPLSFINNGLIRDACGRLLDKSFFVRKNAALFLTAILELNPFGPTLKCESLAENLVRLYAERRELKKQNPEHDAVKEALETWEEMKDNFLKWIKGAVKRNKQDTPSADGEETETTSSTSSSSSSTSDESESDSSSSEEMSVDDDEPTSSALKTKKGEELAKEAGKRGFSIEDLFVQGNAIDKDRSLEQWLQAIIPLLDDPKSRKGAVDLFVRISLAGIVPTVDKGEKKSTLVQQIYEAIHQYYLQVKVGSYIDDDEEMLEEEDKISDFSRKMRRLETKITFCRDALMFAMEMERCIDPALRLIHAGQANDLPETINLLIMTNKFGIRGADRAVHELFGVIWKKDTAIREILIKAGREIYLCAGENRKTACQKNAENLIRVMLTVSERERISLEKLLCYMAPGDLLMPELLSILIVVILCAPLKLRVAAMRIYSVMCKSCKEYMRSKFAFLIEISRRKRIFKDDDGTFAAEYFHAISMLGSIPSLKDLTVMSERPFRLPITHRVFQCIRAVVVYNIVSEHYRWLTVMPKALNAIFYVAAKPTRLAALIAKGIVTIAQLTYFQALDSQETILALDDAEKGAGNEEVGNVSDDDDEFERELDDLVAREELMLREEEELRKKEAEERRRKRRKGIKEKTKGRGEDEEMPGQQEQEDNEVASKEKRKEGKEKNGVEKSADDAREDEEAVNMQQNGVEDSMNVRENGVMQEQQEENNGEPMDEQGGEEMSTVGEGDGHEGEEQQQEEEGSSEEDSDNDDSEEEDFDEIGPDGEPLDVETLIQKQYKKLLKDDVRAKQTLWETVAERLCAFVGQIALKTLIHVDISFVMEVKRKNELLHVMRRLAKEGPGQYTGTPAPAQELPKGWRPRSALERDSMKRRGFFEIEDQQESDRYGITGISEEEKIAQRAQRICEVEALKPKTLLGRFIPLLGFILRSKKAFSEERVRTSAALALSKLMLLSMDFCKRAMPLFLYYLGHSRSATCRSNLMIAAGDICFRYPNIVEQHSQHLYDRIRDKDGYVRQTCLLVLSHLILNDMVKVHGKVADFARCLIDVDTRVKGLANFFFFELSKKGNIVYNMMPDIISRLSADDEVSLIDFSEIMNILLSFIKKDKQADSLLEKLCSRLQGAIQQNGTVDERLVERISYCMSRLPLSEKSVRHLSDQLPSFAFLLSFDSVYNNIHTAVTNFKKNVVRNSELKCELDDFLNALTKMHVEKVEDGGIIDRGLLLSKKRPTRTPHRSRRAHPKELSESP